ncbi:unnamed protein product [Rotaria sp. Silwood2]|nr:unnamed protein product [Rotaria sp. Silwood2]
MCSHLSIRDRWRIISLRSDQGMASDEIASRINCSIRTAYYILQLFRETNDVIEREGRGRRLLNESFFQMLQSVYLELMIEVMISRRLS